jgi:hypothetical protein
MALCFRILARPGTESPNETGGEGGALDPDAVKGYTAMEDRFVGSFPLHKGESIQEAKARLHHRAA